MRKLAEASVAIKASLHLNIKNISDVDDGEGAVCITL